MQSIVNADRPLRFIGPCHNCMGQCTLASWNVRYELNQCHGDVKIVLFFIRYLGAHKIIPLNWNPYLNLTTALLQLMNVMAATSNVQQNIYKLCLKLTTCIHLSWDLSRHFMVMYIPLFKSNSCTLNHVLSSPLSLG